MESKQIDQNYMICWLIHDHENNKAEKRMRKEVMVGMAREVFSNEVRGDLQEERRQPRGTWGQSVPGKNPGSRVRTGEARVAGAVEPRQSIMGNELRIVGARQGGYCRSCRSL